MGLSPGSSILAMEAQALDCSLISFNFLIYNMRIMIEFYFLQ